MCSPRAWGWPELGQEMRRCGHTAKTSGGGCGGSAPATTRTQPGQQVAREGPIGSRKGAWAAARPWEAGGGGARRWRRGWRGGVAGAVLGGARRKGERLNRGWPYQR
jgi:hypothetical protein